MKLVSKLSVNEWKNTISVITWFGNINNKRLYKFLQFDIKDFYPSITGTLLNEAIQFAKEHVPITRKDVEIIFHARKSVLDNNGEPWLKKESMVVLMLLWEHMMGRKCVNLLASMFYI